MINEDLTSKTIRPTDKIKVARVIADMLDVDKVESMTPEAAINMGLRKIRNKRMTPELIKVLTKMLKLAQDVGVKVDMSLVPKAVKEEADLDEAMDVVTPLGTRDSGAEGNILRLKDYVAQQRYPKAESKVGQSMHPVEGDEDHQDHVRRMKVKFKTEDMASADYKVNPETGRKFRAHKINFANSGAKGKLDHSDEKEVQEQTVDIDTGAQKEKMTKTAAKATLILRHAKEREALASRHDTQKKAMEEVEHLDELSNDTLQSYKKKASADASMADQSGDTKKADKRFSGIVKATNKQFDNDMKKYKTEDLDEEVVDNDDFEILDLSDDELDALVDNVDFDDLVDVVDDDELTIIDPDTGEEIEDDDPVNEEALMEVLSRSERMKARIRFKRTGAKRQRRMQIALKRRADPKTINIRARRLAIKLLKQRLIKKPVSKMSVTEKERVERMIQQRRKIIDRLAMRLAPKVRRMEADRLAGSKSETPRVGV